MVSGQSPFWNPILETLPLERLRKLQFQKFKKILSWAYARSPFYRRLYRSVGLQPGEIKSLDQIKLVPKVEKAMLREVQSREPFPYGDILAVPREEIEVFRQTSGTTGTPVFHAASRHDWECYTEDWAHILYAQGYRPTDRVFVPFGYNVFVAFWGGHQAAEKIGCEVVPGGVLDTAARVLKMQELRCNAFMATPTYVLGLAETARTKLDLEVRELGIERITCAGEPGASIPATKRRMEETWGAKVFDHIGATEWGAWSYECLVQPGGLHVNEASYLIEIEDLETGEEIAEPDRPGRMVITALDFTAKPAIRFDSKDVIQWADYSCDCGRTFRLIKGGVLGRTDDIIKVKGVLLAPTAIEEVVRSFPELGDEYQVIVDRKGMVDDILVKVELRSEYEADKEKVMADLKNQLRLKTNLGFRLEIHPLGALPRYAIKAKRFIDLRKKG